MGKVIILPGLMGSELFEASENKLFWADKGQLFNRGVGPMKLDGTVAGNPDASARLMVSGWALKDYYRSGFDALTEQLATTPYANPVMFGYDWRQSMLATAALLKTQIESLYSTGQPVTIVGHSLGGLIARLAYLQLNIAGNANKVRRIITLGAPHQGSFSIMKLWTGETNEGFLFVMGDVLRNGPYSILTPIKTLLANLLNITTTWPSLYELLPFVKNDRSASDEFRMRMFSRDFWDTRLVMYQPLFNSALSGVQRQLQDARSIPAGRRTVCVIGRGYPTWEITGARTSDGANISSVSRNGGGDGIVTQLSATLPDCQEVNLEGAHQSLFKQMGESGELAKLIVENFDGTPDVPVPPVKVSLKAPDAFQQPPPFPTVSQPVRLRGKPKRVP